MLLEAEECSIRPAAVALKLLEQLLGGLQDIKLGVEPRRERRSGRRELWSVHFSHLVMQDGVQGLDEVDHLRQLGQSVVLVFP